MLVPARRCFRPPFNRRMHHAPHARCSGEDSVISAIEERIARWTLLPVGNGEGLQVLHYKVR